MSIVSFLLILAAPVAAIAGYGIRAYMGKVKLSSAEAQSQRIIQDSIRDAENKRRELLLEAKDQLIKEKNQFEKEQRERRIELQNVERRILQKEESIDAKTVLIEKKEKELEFREGENLEKEEELKKSF